MNLTIGFHFIPGSVIVIKNCQLHKNQHQEDHFKMRTYLQLLIIALFIILAGCGTDSDNQYEYISDEPGKLIWGGSPAVDGTGLLLETADTTYGTPGSYEDYESYFPDNEYSVEVIADFLITGEITTRGWGVQFPEIRLTNIEVPD